MEYASGGELFDYIVAKGRVPENEACRFFQEIIDGVEYLHSLNIVHRDLKPENLLIDHKSSIKIVDFGLSNTYPSKTDTLLTACGSPCYAAPEMIAGKRYLGAKVDLWSCGIIMFALICGYLPFEDPNTTILYQKILKGEFHIPRFVSKDASDLLRNILTTDPDKRYGFKDIRNHSWFNLVPQKQKTGLKEVVINEKLLKIMEEKFKFDAQEGKTYLDGMRHNHLTTTYYLMEQKLKRAAEDQADEEDQPRL